MAPEEMLIVMIAILLSLLVISIKMVLQPVDWSILKSALYKKDSEFLDTDGNPQDVDCSDTDATLNPFDGDEDGLSTCDGDCDDEDENTGIIDEDGDGANACRTDCDDSNADLNDHDVDEDGLSTCDGL